MTTRSSRRPRETSLLWGWACALTACYLSPVQTVSADPHGISLEYTGAPYAHVMRIADRHCAQYGKDAWPTDNVTVGDAYHYLQRFDCRARTANPPQAAQAR